MTDLQQLKTRLVDRSRALGFTLCRVTDAEAEDTTGRHLDDFLAAGYHGDMAWMAETRDRRRHPKALWPAANTAIVLGITYGPETDPLASLDLKDRATISVYARNRDYHDIIKGRLKELAGLIPRAVEADVKVFVDTAPLMEKPLAQRAGLGWQGKHTNLVSRDAGSWLFLGVILTTAYLPPDAPGIDHCGTCSNCLDVCPTQAFPAPYKLDARRCISYLTIEHKGPIPVEFRRRMGNRIYGCDDCLAVCPWNKFARLAQEHGLQARDDPTPPSLASLASLDESGFRALFSGSPIKRIGWARFMRNVLIAIGNSGDPGLASKAGGCLEAPSPLIRGAAVWALSQLLSRTTLRARYGAVAARETDLSVTTEWEWALGKTRPDMKPAWSESR